MYEELTLEQMVDRDYPDDEVSWDDGPICVECDSALCGDCGGCLNPECEMNKGHQLCGVDAGRKGDLR